MTPTVLVTGASGLVGNAVIGYLSGQYRCVGLGRRVKHSGEYMQGDLRDSTRMLEVMRVVSPEIVVHAGAVSHPVMYADNPSEVYRSNVEGTLNTLEAARLTGVRRFVYVSSAAVYGSRSPSEVLVEGTSLRPTNIYGATKAAGEMLVSGYGGAFGLETVTLRLVSIYGSGRETFSVPTFLLACAVDSLPVHLRFGDQPTDYLYIDDACRAVKAAIETTQGVSQAFTIASGSQATNRDVALEVSRLVDNTDISIDAGVDQSWQEGKYDVSLATRVLDFSHRTSLSAGLRLMFEDMATDITLRSRARAAGPNPGVAVVTARAV